MDDEPQRRYRLIMRMSAMSAANIVAWAVLVGLTGLAFGMVVYLGPFGLILLGVAILFVCTSMNLRDETPIAATELLRARFTSSGAKSPEQRAAMLAEKHALLSSLRFFRHCGAVLVVAGAVGFIWQHWQ